jgi:hypothetical protein
MLSSQEPGQRVTHTRPERNAQQISRVENFETAGWYPVRLKPSEISESAPKSRRAMTAGTHALPRIEILIPLF